MSDRELIRASARAAGYAIHAYRQAERDRDYPEQIGLWIPRESTFWNPLVDSDDALRLAVKLRIVVDCEFEGSDGKPATHCFVFRQGLGYLRATEPHGSDPYAATRRAIVRAAAAIAGEGKL